MTRRFMLSVLLLAAFCSPALAAPRDAASVLNRCGKPLKGDETILESTVTGGRRILSYERGELHFDKVANDGWTFAYGKHRKLDHLTAEQMEKFMPCLKDALELSVEPEPLKMITPVQRVEVSVKHDYKAVVLYTVLFLVVLGLIFLWWAKRTPEDEEPTDEV